MTVNKLSKSLKSILKSYLICISTIKIIIMNKPQKKNLNAKIVIVKWIKKYQRNKILNLKKNKMNLYILNQLKDLILENNTQIVHALVDIPLYKQLLQISLFSKNSCKILTLLF